MGLRHILLGAAASSLVASAALADRGSDGQLNILYWQAVSIMTPVPVERHQGHPGREPRPRAARPLRRDRRDDALSRRVDPDGRERRRVQGPADDHLEAQGRAALVGRLAGDRRRCCLHLAVLHRPQGRLRAALELQRRDQSVEAVDPRTIKITFGVAKPFPYGPLVGAQSPLLQKKQFADCIGEKAPTCTEANTKPIGTGPFMVTDFKANDVVSLAANPHYRDPAKPAFATAVIKGGGDRRQRRALGAGDRRVRLRLEHPGRARDPRADGRRREGRGASRPSARWSSGCRSTRPTPTRRSATSARPRRTRTRS